MATDDPMREGALRSLDHATRALNYGNTIIALRLSLDAASYMWSLNKRDLDVSSEDYKDSSQKFAEGLSRLPPSVVRQALKIIEGGDANE